MEQAGGDYFTAKENLDPDEQLRIFCEQVDAEQVERDKELFAFLEELINSEEFRPKKDKKDASTQVLPLYLEKYAKETKELVRDLVDDYSLTKYYQKRYAEENLKNVKLRLSENKKMRAWQDEAITIIKEHIYRAARQHACHLKERIAYKLNNIEKALGGIAYRPELKKKAVDYVISMKRIKHNQTIGRKEREVSIIKKLLAEKRRWKQIQALQNKTYDYKVKRRQREILVEEVGEESMVSGLGVCDEYYEEVPPLEEYIPVEAIKEETKKDKKQKKDKKGKKEKKEKKDKKGKGEKKKKKDKKDKKKKKGDKKGKKDKKKKGKEKSIPDLVLPEVPITNPREKIKPDDPELMLDIIRQHEELLMVLDEKRRFDEMFDEEEISYEKDVTCFWRPNPVLFDNFQNGKCYKKQIAIINGGTHVKKIKLYSAIIDDGFDPYLICVDKFGIAVVIPGLSFNVALTFRPRQLNHVTYGKLTFLCYEANKNRRMQFSVPIKCVPYIKTVFVTPIHINFGKCYFWELNNIKPKRLRIISTDSKLYRVAVKKILEESEMETISQSISTPSLMNIVQFLKEITEVCHHNFRLSRYFSELHPNSGFEIKIFPKNLDHIGDYYERYECQFFEEIEEEVTFVGCQECIVSAEIIGHFIDITPNILDFGVCSFGSIYQERFSILNNDGTSHRVLLQFPSNLKPYLSSNMAEIIITSYSTREISLKFMPREDMIDGLLSCYDPETKILKFPVKAQITTKDYENIPPIRLTIYAILTENLGLTIRPLNLEFAKRNGDDFLLDLGPCLTRETVFAKMGITNSTATRQDYGFLDLPSCVTISPNYGFGYLDPYESRELLLQFSPEAVDLSNCPTTEDKSSLCFRISVTTLKSVGAVKKAFNYKRLRRSFEYIMSILRSDAKDLVVREMMDSLEVLRYSEELIDPRKTADKGVGNLKSSQESEEDSSSLLVTSFVKENWNFDQINTNKIWILSQVIDPPLWLSHQLVIFPDTPCGSFSTMRLQLKTSKYLKDVQCLCGYNRFKMHEGPEEFEVHFEICGDNPEITIEPICGDLVSGNSIDLYLTAKPGVPEEVIEEKARYIKMMEIVAEKRKVLLMKREIERQARLLKEQKAREKKAKKSKKDTKKDKKKKGKKSKTASEDAENKNELEQKPLAEEEEEPLPDIKVNESEIHINYFDLYPAEMIIWKDFQPKHIEANFIIEVTYLGKHIKKPKDFLYLRAICKVVSPSFIHNLDRQHVDFGATAIGSSKRILLELQNVINGVIAPRLSLLSSDGVFICPSVTAIPVPAEHVLRIPLTFKPIDEAEAIVVVDRDDINLTSNKLKEQISSQFKLSIQQ